MEFLELKKRFTKLFYPLVVVEDRCWRYQTEGCLHYFALRYVYNISMCSICPCGVLLADI